MNRTQIADKYFMKGYSCSQAVLAAFAEDLGLDVDICFKVAAGFGSGMGGLADTCGALTGAFIVVGMHYGGEPAQKHKTYDMVRKVAAKFRERNKGQIHCRDLLGVDLSTDEGMRSAKKNKLFRTACREFVRDAVDILDEVILESDELGS
ncbi:MAG: C-GCAxxG-C-C family protein [Desulfobulbaceae bacterium]|nr:C-GCAxxG-C-C family protein [Desulfobulbaceae bacterium]